MKSTELSMCQSQECTTLLIMHAHHLAGMLLVLACCCVMPLLLHGIKAGLCCVMAATFKEVEAAAAYLV